MGNDIASDLLQAILEKLPFGVALFSPEYSLRMHNTRFASLTGIPTEGVGPGTGMGSWLDRMMASTEYAGSEGPAFIAALRAWDRRSPFRLRRRRTTGQVIDSTYDPLPDGGFAVTVTDVSEITEFPDRVFRLRGESEAFGFDTRVAARTESTERLGRGTLNVMCTVYAAMATSWRVVPHR